MTDTPGFYAVAMSRTLDGIRDRVSALRETTIDEADEGQRLEHVDNALDAIETALDRAIALLEREGR